jgi:hypothetical protein
MGVTNAPVQEQRLLCLDAHCPALNPCLKHYLSPLSTPNHSPHCSTYTTRSQSVLHHFRTIPPCACPLLSDALDERLFLCGPPRVGLPSRLARFAGRSCVTPAPLAYLSGHRLPRLRCGQSRGLLPIVRRGLNRVLLLAPLHAESRTLTVSQAQTQSSGAEADRQESDTVQTEDIDVAAGLGVNERSWDDPRPTLADCPAWHGSLIRRQYGER